MPARRAKTGAEPQIYRVWRFECDLEAPDEIDLLDIKSLLDLTGGEADRQRFLDHDWKLRAWDLNACPIANALASTIVRNDCRVCPTRRSDST